MAKKKCYQSNFSKILSFDFYSRRSYRKTAQLNDFRFASGFGADARRKRHTADSGYGSEQPLDRRWSQEFNQEVRESRVNEYAALVFSCIFSFNFNRNKNLSWVYKKIGWYAQFFLGKILQISRS